MTAQKKKFKRRSQLPPRPETDDEEDIIADSQLEDDDMASFIDDGDSRMLDESEIIDDESMDAEDFSDSDDDRPAPKSKSKYGRIISLDSDEDDDSDDDKTPDSLESDEDDFGKKPAHRKMIINSDSESD